MAFVLDYTVACILHVSLLMRFFNSTFFAVRMEGVYHFTHPDQQGGLFYL